MIKIKAYANCDHAYVAWQIDKVIVNCLGFALYRRAKGKSAEAVTTFVGPENGPKLPSGTSRPSTVWPIQKFMWADYLATAGTTLQYQVVPMCGPDFDHLKPSTAEASTWSGAVTLDVSSTAAVQPYFNRGVVSTQWVARQLQASKGKTLKSLVDPDLGKTNKIRDFLGGILKERLLDLLATQEKAGGHIYASLFELSDPEVIPAILKFGQRAHIILADGTHAAPKAKKGQKAPPKQPKGKPFDENSVARGLLRKGHVELHDRMVTGDHFCHHKFIVFTDPKATTKAVSVWSGSSNLTYGGVCTQANNGFLIRDTTLADRFLQQWRELVKDVNTYPASLTQFDAKPVVSTVNGGKITAWFAPNPQIKPTPKKGNKNKYGDHPDLKFARSFIQNAREGVLFLMLNPGFAGTLLNDILDLLDDPKKDAKLYIHGVANQDPTGGSPKGPLIFVHRNQKQKTYPAEKDIILPAAIPSVAGLSKKDKAAAAALAKWVKLVDNTGTANPAALASYACTAKSFWWIRSANTP